MEGVQQSKWTIVEIVGKNVGGQDGQKGIVRSACVLRDYASSLSHIQGHSSEDGPANVKLNAR